ncbi:MAG: FecR domain-containing protein [bacterium]|nr:FecR domain-containing protein [bacterium]
MVEKQDFEALIVRYLEGIATPEEAMELEDWKKISSENQQLYNHYEELFSQNRLQQVDTDRAWMKVSGEISQKTRIVSLKDWRHWAMAAAAILVIALIIPTLMDDGGTTKMDEQPIAEKEEESNILYAKNGVKSFNLEDNSTVELAEGSSLELSKDFKSGDRRSKLKGSGRFTVVHDEAHPFVIDVEGLEVYDIGTVFDITTTKDTVKVVVMEGAVELRKNGQVLAMEEGDSAFYLISQQLILEYPDKEVLDGIIYKFTDVPLQEIVRNLSAHFKRNIVIMDEGLKKKTFTVEFKGQDLPEAIKLLELSDLRFVIKNDKIEIYDAS